MLVERSSSLLMSVINMGIDITGLFVVDAVNGETRYWPLV